MCCAKTVTTLLSAIQRGLRPGPGSGSVDGLYRSHAPAWERGEVAFPRRSVGMIKTAQTENPSRGNIVQT
jgi:hypothetical protein